MKKKKKPPVVVSAQLQETQERLCQTFRLWEDKFGGTIKWPNAKAHRYQWWDVAASFCLANECPAPLLIYIVFAFGNARAEDAEIPFSATSFRSETVLNRALANWRSCASSAIKNHLEVLYELRTGKKLCLPVGTLTAARLFADLYCEYLETSLMVQSHPLTKLGPVDDEVRDMLAYHNCKVDKNPFALLRVARTPRMRAIATANAYVLAKMLPWHQAVWEGICCPHSLDQPEEMAGDPNVRDFYANRQLRWYWPEHPLAPGLVANRFDTEFRPSMCLIEMHRCSKTDLFLAVKLTQAKKNLA